MKVFILESLFPTLVFIFIFILIMKRKSDNLIGEERKEDINVGDLII